MSGKKNLKQRFRLNLFWVKSLNKTFIALFLLVSVYKFLSRSYTTKLANWPLVLILMMYRVKKAAVLTKHLDDYVVCVYNLFYIQRTTKLLIVNGVSRMILDSLKLKLKISVCFGFLGKKI